VAAGISGQSSQHGALEIPQDAAGPDPLLLGDRESGDGSGTRPLAEKIPVAVKDLDPLVVPIGDVYLSLRVSRTET